MALLPDDFPRHRELPEGNGGSPVKAVLGDPLGIIAGIFELGRRKERDALEQWQKAREATFAEMIYDDLTVLDDAMALLADRSKSSATTRKYKLHWDRFTKWTAEFVMDDGYPLSPLPACPELVAFFLLSELRRGQSYSSVKQAAGAISDAHTTNHLVDPTQALVCRAAVRLARQYDGKFSKAKSNDKDCEPAKSNGANGEKLEHEP